MRREHLLSLDAAIRAAGYGEYYISKCLRYANRLLINGLPVIFDTQHLALLIGISSDELCKMVFAEDRFYSTARIPKRNGGYRELDIPSSDLKYIQKWIMQNILYCMRVSDYAYGFQPKRSIVDNARVHVNKHCIVNLDISDFFPSISFERVFRLFFYYGYTKEVSFVLAKLCTFRGKLPQGSPASPCISNICCLKLDARLSALATKYKADYSRYADDITFSSNSDLKTIIRIVAPILLEEGFRVNERKTRISYHHQRQEVTGHIVNGENVRVSKEFKRSLLQELYYCKRFGVSDHMRHIGCNKAFYKEHVYGKLFFVNMVEPDEAKKLFALADSIDWEY